MADRPKTTRTHAMRWLKMIAVCSIGVCAAFPCVAQPAIDNKFDPKCKDDVERAFALGITFSVRLLRSSGVDPTFLNLNGRDALLFAADALSEHAQKLRQAADKR